MPKSLSMKRWAAMLALGTCLSTTLAMPYAALADSNNTTSLSLNSTVNATALSSNSTNSTGSGGGSIGVGGNKTGSTGTSVLVGGSVGVSTGGKSSGGTGTTSEGKTSTGTTPSTSGSGSSHASGSAGASSRTKASGGSKPSGKGHASGQGKVSVGGKTEATTGAKTRAKTSGNTSTHVKVGTKTHRAPAINGSGQAGMSLSVKAKAGGQAGAAANVVGQLGVSIGMHNPVQLAAYQLESTLVGLGIDETDYLYAYLQTVPLTTTGLHQIEANETAIDTLLVRAGTGTLRRGQVGKGVPQVKLAAAWKLIIDSWTQLGLQPELHSNTGDSINILTYTGTGPLSVILKDQHATPLGTEIIQKGSVTPTLLKKISQSQVTIGHSITTLKSTGNFVPAPYGALPKTATQDLLMMVLGALTFSIGVGGLIWARARKTNAHPYRS